MTGRFGFTITQNRIARLVLAVAVGSAIGIVGYTFVYAKGYSYLSNDPVACANCHIMNEQYDGWTRSSHHAVATCNDCHTPPDFIGKYTPKRQTDSGTRTILRRGRFTNRSRSASEAPRSPNKRAGSVTRRWSKRSRRIPRRLGDFVRPLSSLGRTPALTR